MRLALIFMLVEMLLSGCLHFPVADEKCNLTCYGYEAITNKWCAGMWNYVKCGDS